MMNTIRVVELGNKLGFRVTRGYNEPKTRKTLIFCGFDVTGDEDGTRITYKHADKYVALAIRMLEKDTETIEIDIFNYAAHMETIHQAFLELTEGEQLPIRVVSHGFGVQIFGHLAMKGVVFDRVTLIDPRFLPCLLETAFTTKH
jgi:hypothetical protein